MTTVTLPEGRTLPDRRRRRTPMLSVYWLRGRRRSGRRAGETGGIYVDRYAPREVMLFVALVALSAADLLLTLRHVEAGGTEANPVMAWFLTASGPAAFAAAKLTATIGGALVLLLHVRFRRVARVLALLVLAYVVLMGWHAVVVWW